MVDAVNRDLYARIQSSEVQERVNKTIRLFDQLVTWRTAFSEQFEEVAALIWPEQRNTFFWNSYTYPGTKLTDRMLDSTGMLALEKFTAIIQSLLSPPDARWHELTTTNPDLNKNRRVAEWFERATKILFAHRYAPYTGFNGQTYATYKSLGAFGTAGIFVDELQDDVYGRRGLRYRNIPTGELYLIENQQGIVEGFIRPFKMTARQAWLTFHDEGFPPHMRSDLEKDSPFLHDFLHYVDRRRDYDPDRKDFRGMPFKSEFISYQGKFLCSEGGFRSFPLPTSRWTQAPRETYGRSPAMQVLPSLKTLNEVAGMWLKVGHRTADPALFVYDDGLIDGVNIEPGAINKGGVSPDGRMLVQPLPVGNIQVGREVMEWQAASIKDSFLISLFDILVDTPQKTATEVLERLQEKSILLAPEIGRQVELFDPLINRELDILFHLKKLPPMPRELIEAKGEYSIEYTAPLNRYMRSAEIAGISRTVEFALSVVNASGGDHSILDNINFDAAMKEIMDIQGVPPSWINTDQVVQSLRQQRAQVEQQKMQIQAAPSQAALMKAQAAIQKVQAQFGTGGGASAGAPGQYAPPSGPVDQSQTGPTLPQ